MYLVCVFLTLNKNVTPLIYVGRSGLMGGPHPVLEPLHTGAGVAPVSTSVFVYGNCHHTWKHITVDGGDASTGKFHAIMPVGVGAM